MDTANVSKTDYYKIVNSKKEISMVFMKKKEENHTIKMFLKFGKEKQRIRNSFFISKKKLILNF